MAGGIARTGYEGRGKLLFFGEHAAVYGFPAVGVTLPMGIRIDVEEGTGRSGRRFHGVPPRYRAKFEELVDAAGAILQDPGLFDGVDISLESDLPAGSGLGSSASLCVALVGAGARRSGAWKPDPETLWSYAHEAERLFHGVPSGIDTGLASGAGIAALYPRPRALPERRPLAPAPFHIVAGTVPRSVGAAELIRRVGERYAAGAEDARSAIGDLGRIGALAIEAFSTAPTPTALTAALAPLADAAQARLASLGLSTPALEAVLSAGRRAGADVGKMSGAGGGGAFYFLAADRAAAEAVHEAVAVLFRDGSEANTLFDPFFWTGTELVGEALGKKGV